MRPISSQSKEYIKTTVSAVDSSGIINPTSSPVSWAFLTPGAAPNGSTSWTAGSWETQSLHGTTTYLARILIGPGGSLVVAVGSYDVWIQIQYGAETVARFVDQLRI